MIETLGLISSILIGSAAIAWSLYGVRRQMWLQTFLEFTGRYDQIIHDLPEAVRRGDPGATLAAFDHDVSLSIRNSIRRYFNLCSEELYLTSRGHIDSGTWQIWEDGIADFMKSGITGEVWGMVRAEYSGHAGFLDLIDGMVLANRRESRR